MSRMAEMMTPELVSSNSVEVITEARAAYLA